MKGERAMTQAERSRNHRERRKAQGWHLVQVYLEPRSTAIVQRYIDQGMTTAQAVNHCIINFDSDEPVQVNP